jgi:sec-independent protein translocase protein TatB
MLSIPHMIVVFIVVLVVFGPQKLPELAKGLGKLMAEFRKASTDFKSAFENEMRKKRELLAKANAALEAPATLATPSGVQTDPAPAQLAESSSASPVQGERVTEADAGAVMTPIITPVAEAVSRSSDESPTENSASTEASSNANGSSPEHNAAQADADAITEKPQRTASDQHSEDAPHDYRPA